MIERQTTEQWLTVLSPAQRRIVDVLVYGGPLIEVAVTVGRSYRYVTKTLTHVYAALEVGSRPELMAIYWQLRLSDERYGIGGGS